MTRARELHGQNRRRFLRAASLAALVPAAAYSADPELNVLGPRPGYSPQIGTLVSELAWMRRAVVGPVKGLTTEQLDFLLDNKANRPGALLLHLVATEKLYQLNTFDGIGVNEVFTAPAFKDWQLAMSLGDPARQAIKGHNLDYYLNLLQDTREKTLAEFRKRDDAWLMAIDKSWPWGPTDNLCKWFHVCEHESHHTGQISLIKSRIPGIKAENG